MLGMNNTQNRMNIMKNKIKTIEKQFQNLQMRCIFLHIFHYTMIMQYMIFFVQLNTYIT